MVFDRGDRKSGLKLKRGGFVHLFPIDTPSGEVFFLAQFEFFNAERRRLWKGLPKLQKPGYLEAGKPFFAPLENLLGIYGLALFWDNIGLDLLIGQL